MKTYPINSESGDELAFEIENAYIGTRKIAALLANVSGVTDVCRRRLFSSSDDVHLQFRFHGYEFVVWEPYGDNSRYWVGPKNEKERPKYVNELRAAFEYYKPPFLIHILGDVITLNFRFRKKRNKGSE